MAMSKTCSEKRKSMLHLLHAMEKLQRSLSLKWSATAFIDRDGDGDDDDGEGFGEVGKMKEGHFAVLAVNDRQPKKFVVALRYLNHPQFLRLLEQAAEEFGFGRKGALAIKCQPSELEGILREN